jgi:general secretion pathway protein G
MIGSIHGIARRQLSARRSGFTLVEILIVVIILGILAAIVIPQFTNASTSAKASAVTSQLQTLRSQVQLYKLQHNDAIPDLVGTQWTLLMGKTTAAGTIDAANGTYGPYLETIPKNPLNGNSNIAAAVGASDTGWVYDQTTGNIFATNQSASLSFDESNGTVK